MRALPRTLIEIVDDEANAMALVPRVVRINGEEVLVTREGVTLSQPTPNAAMSVTLELLPDEIRFVREPAVSERNDSADDDNVPTECNCCGCCCEHN